MHKEGEELDNRFDREMTTYEKCLDCCGGCMGTGRLYCPCICCCVESPAQMIHTTQAGLLQKFGKFINILDAGLNYINPLTQNVIRVDMRTRILDPHKQPVITKDNVSLTIDSSIYFRVINAKICAYKIGADPAKINATVLEMCHAALRTICGERTFQELLEDREVVAKEILSVIQSQISVWGIYVENVFLKDLHLPAQTERNMSSAAVNLRLSQAKIIGAKAEVDAAKMLKEASDILDSRAAMQIRYLQIIQLIASNPNRKLVFMPLNNNSQ